MYISGLAKPLNFMFMKRLVFFVMLMFFAATVWAQKAVPSYGFSQSSGTYESIVGLGEGLVSGDGGDIVLDLTGQFAFPYNGKVYSKFYVKTDGVIGLGDITYVSYSNNLASTSYCPVLAPLWDDLKVMDSVYYYLDAANDKLIIEWHQAKYYYANDTDTVNFQVILDGNTGVIAFVYGDMSLAANWNASASIGINDNEGGSTAFASVTPGSPATVSYTTANNSIDGATLSSIAEGTVYTFTPPSLDLAPVAVLNPTDVFRPSNMTSVEILVTNGGVNTAVDYSLSVTVFDTVNNLILLDTTITGLSIGGFTSDTVNAGVFVSDYNETYLIEAVTSVSGDELSDNDTLRQTVSSQVIIASLPYFEGFEEAFPPHGWMNEGWTWGSESYEGDHCARVSYSHSGEAILTSPLLVYDGSVKVSFYWKDDDISLKVQDHDTTFFEYSTDYGETWMILDTLSAESRESDYHMVVHYFTFNSGDTVLFRFRDVTDASFSAYGTGVDNFSIDEALLHDIGIVDLMPGNDNIVMINQPVPVLATLVNNGLNDEVGFTVTATLVDADNMSQIYTNTVTVNDTLASGAQVQVDLGSFTAELNKNYILTVVVNLEGDERSSNDTLQTQFYSQLLISNYPYEENFDYEGEMPRGWFSPDGNWTIEDNTIAHSGDYLARVSYSHDSTACLYSPYFYINGIATISWWWVDDDIYKIQGHDTTFFEYSIDMGQTWTTIDTLSAESVMDSMINAQYVIQFDHDTVLFRFRDVTDGTASAYGTGVDDFGISVEEVNTSVINLAGNLIVYPNPANDVLYIKTGHTGSVEIFGLQGQKVKTYKFYGNAVINVGDLTPGAYLIRLVSDDGTVSMAKFIKR